MTKRILERSKISGRTDDNLESLMKRFKTFEVDTKPIIQYYASQNKVFTVDYCYIMLIRFRSMLINLSVRSLRRWIKKYKQF
jgi:Adenylate kinase.